ncbi:MAG: hypothetical protein LUF30_07905, partial [Lachnospiraceae bacterium]|nr:hypothetical protein [Lachnospiraceae bacterium]
MNREVRGIFRQIPRTNDTDNIREIAGSVRVIMVVRSVLVVVMPMEVGSILVVMPMEVVTKHMVVRSVLFVVMVMVVGIVLVVTETLGVRI